MDKKRLLFVYNPNSGKRTVPKKLSDIVDIFTRGGFTVTVHPTSRRLDCLETVSAEMVSGEYERLVVAGGDGTLNEAVNGLISIGYEGCYGYIPCGSTNDFSKSVGIPTKISDAAENAVYGTPTRFDAGRLNERYFTYVAAFGTLAEVSYSTPQDAKNQLGFIAYILNGLEALPNITTYQMSYESDERSGEGDYVLGLVLNTLHVGGLELREMDDIKLDDGLFEVFLVKTPKDVFDWNGIIASLLNRDYDNKHIECFKTSKITIHSAKPMAWTVDGESGGSFTESVIEVIPKAVNVFTSDK